MCLHKLHHGLMCMRYVELTFCSFYKAQLEVMSIQLRIEELLRVVIMEGVNGPDKSVLKVIVGVIFPIITCIISVFLEIELKIK